MTLHIMEHVCAQCGDKNAELYLAHSRLLCWDCVNGVTPPAAHEKPADPPMLACICPSDVVNNLGCQCSGR